MVFKKNIKLKIIVYTILFSILCLIDIISIINPDFDLCKILVIFDGYKDILFWATIYVVIIIKVNIIDKRKRYIIKDNKIVIYNYGEIKEFDINHIVNIIEIFNPKRNEIMENRYYVIIKGIETNPIRIRQDLYNEDGNTLISVLLKKYDINLLCKDYLDWRSFE